MQYIMTTAQYTGRGVSPINSSHAFVYSGKDVKKAIPVLYPDPINQ
jgi:hypothetical protein